MIDLQDNPNTSLKTVEKHCLMLPSCCPVSQNPKPGSYIIIRYMADKYFLEVASLKKYIQSYVGGKGEIRSMEGMIQQIAMDCAQALNVRVFVKAVLNIAPEQKMVIQLFARPK